MELYEIHKASRDKFEIIAIHDSSVKSMEELKEKIEPLKKKWWQGRDIPFPIVIDKNQKTEKRYDVQGWPSYYLIDPKGNMVGPTYSKGRSFGKLEDQLPPVPATIRLSYSYDRRPNVYHDQTANTRTVLNFTKFSKNIWNTELEIDEASLKQIGLNRTSELSAMYIGTQITLRSFEQIELHSNGLEIATSTSDPTKLVIQARNPKSSKSKLSKVQLIIEQRLKALVAKKENKAGKKKVVQIKKLNLPEMLLRVATGVDDLNLAVGKSVLSDEGFDLQETRFSGTIDLFNVGESFNKILGQHGLHAKVRGEFLMIEKKASPR